MNPSSNRKIAKSRLLDPGYLPVEWPDDLLPSIKQRIAQRRRKIVVLDDDPTGTQTVHGIPVLTHWSVAALSSEMQSTAPAFYLLTNSRSLSSPDAYRLAIEIGINLKKALQQTDIPIEVISRSDSTLRGHFPDEVDALAQAMGLAELPYLILPCFFEGGRYTVNDVHYVEEGEWLVPAAKTAYAQDAVFGYQHSNLRDWVEEKTGGRIRQDRIESISLDDIRVGGPHQVTQILTKLKRRSACVVNAVSYKDLEVFVLGLLEAEQQGHGFMFRSAASFVRVRAGLTQQGLLEKETLFKDREGNQNGGLFVVGSYVPKTTEQMQALQAQPDIFAIELNVKLLLDDERQPDEIRRACQEMNDLIKAHRDVLIYTSRELVTGSDAVESLAIGQRISDSLIEVVKGLQVLPRYLVAKGGITSSDIATQGLGVRRAMVMGQILPGVPVWRLGDESRYPGMAYVVFPGNVGGIDALVDIQTRLCSR